MFGLDRITHDPDILDNKACIRGMRLSVALIVNLVANGMSAQEIIAEYPDLTPKDIRQALRYAAWAAEDTTHTLTFLDVLAQAAETVKQVTVDPNIMHGAPCIAGTRIPVYVILEKLEGGYSIDRIRQAYPHLTREQIQAAVRYAAKVMDASACEKATQSAQSIATFLAKWRGALKESEPDDWDHL